MSVKHMALSADQQDSWWPMCVSGWLNPQIHASLKGVAQQSFIQPVGWDCSKWGVSYLVVTKPLVSLT